MHASGDLVNYGPSDYTRCQIWVSTTPIAGVSTLVGEPSQPGAIGPAGLLSPFALVGGTSNATRVSAALCCEHDDSNGAYPYVDGAASMWAHKTNGFKLANE